MHAWDEAVAFYAGSTVGGDHGTSETGELQFGFWTRDVRIQDARRIFYGSQVNADIIAHFTTGKGKPLGSVANGDMEVLT